MIKPATIKKLRPTTISKAPLCPCPLPRRILPPGPFKGRAYDRTVIGEMRGKRKIVMQGLPLRMQIGSTLEERSYSQGEKPRENPSFSFWDLSCLASKWSWWIVQNDTLSPAIILKTILYGQQPHRHIYLQCSNIAVFGQGIGKVGRQGAEKVHISVLIANGAIPRSPPCMNRSFS